MCITPVLKPMRGDFAVLFDFCLSGKVFSETRPFPGVLLFDTKRSYLSPTLVSLRFSFSFSPCVTLCTI